MQRLNAERRNFILYYLASLQENDYFANRDRLNSIRLNTDDNLVNLLVSEHFPDDKVIIAIRTILTNKTYLCKDLDTGMNFIQLAINSGYCVDTLCELIHIASSYDFDFNDVDNCGQSIMHTAINNPLLQGSLEKLYDTLKCFGYNENSLNGDTLISGINFCQKISKYSKSHIEKLENLRKYILEYDVNKEKGDTESRCNIVVSEDDSAIFNSYGLFLTDKKYVSSPAIGRETELENIYLSFAQNDINVLLVGPSGSGKTALVEQLAYEIQNDNVPFYLKDKKIFEVSAGDMVAGTRYRGDFEEKLQELFELCIKYDILLFIDEMHTIYGAGSSSESDNDFADFMKIYIKRGLRVIGATTDIEYDKYFSHDALKRRFDKVEIKVPSHALICDIIIKRLNDLEKIYHINSDVIIYEYPEIINLLLDATNKKNILYNDQMNNPDFVLSIVNKAVACARRDGVDKLTIKHLIKAVSLTDRLYPNVREKLYKKLENLLVANVSIKKGECIDISSRRTLYLKD